MRIVSVQLLRTLAAVSVLSGHALEAISDLDGSRKPAFPYGMGVDLFFAISGFIMAYSCDRLFTQTGAGKEFLIKRAARVVPLYWGSTTALLVLVLLGTGRGEALPPLSYVVSSYLFVPDNTFGSVDGIPFPLLSLGWTLNYEVLFYLVFSIFIFLPRPLATAAVQLTILIAVLIGTVFQPASIVLSTWTQPIILEFALGLWIGNAFLDGVRISRLSSIVLLGSASLWAALDPSGLLAVHQTPNDFQRLIGWGLPATLILSAFVLGPEWLPAGLERPVTLLGDASYSLYLTHPFILISLNHAWLGLFGPRYLALMAMLGVVLAIAFATAVNRLVERPFARRLQRFHSPVRAAVQPAES